MSAFKKSIEKIEELRDRQKARVEGLRRRISESQDLWFDVATVASYRNDVCWLAAYEAVLSVMRGCERENPEPAPTPSAPEPCKLHAEHDAMHVCEFDATYLAKRLAGRLGVDFKENGWLDLVIARFDDEIASAARIQVELTKQLSDMRDRATKAEKQVTESANRNGELKDLLEELRRLNQSANEKIEENRKEIEAARAVAKAAELKNPGSVWRSNRQKIALKLIVKSAQGEPFLAELPMERAHRFVESVLVFARSVGVSEGTMIDLASKAAKGQAALSAKRAAELMSVQFLALCQTVSYDAEQIECHGIMKLPGYHDSVA